MLGLSPGTGTQGLSALPGWEQHLPGRVPDLPCCPPAAPMALCSLLLAAGAAPGLTPTGEGQRALSPWVFPMRRAVFGDSLWQLGAQLSQLCGQASPLCGCCEPGLAPGACLVIQHSSCGMRAHCGVPRAAGTCQGLGHTGQGHRRVPLLGTRKGHSGEAAVTRVAHSTTGTW